MMTNDVTERIIRAAMKVHTAIGPGLLEKAYDACLFHELSTEELQFEHQIKVPVAYREVRLDVGFRIDYLVENCVLVELKPSKNFSRSTRRNCSLISNCLDARLGC